MTEEKKIVRIGYQIAWELVRNYLTPWPPPNPLSRPVKGWHHRLDREFDKKFKILNENCKAPNIILDGEYSLAPELQAEASRQRADIEAKHRRNSPHAILSQEPNWHAAAVNLHVESLDFASVSALREVGQRPEILSACAVIICREKKEILLQQRAPDVATYPRHLHTLGGAFIPTVAGTEDPDRGGALITILREVLEESQMGLSADDRPHLMISKELTTGFIQLVFLGFNVSVDTMDRGSGNWEGELERIPFRNLPKILREQNWVPSGKAQVLAWLALGAPNAGIRPRFDGQSPKQLFDSLVES